MAYLQADQIVLGLGGTVDYEIAWSNAIFQKLVDDLGITLREVQSSPVIRSERELVCNVIAHLQKSRGGEIPVSDSVIVKTFSERFEKRVTLGGTGVRAAIAMAKFGQKTTQHLVSIDGNVRTLLPTGTKYICSADYDSLDPHLIVQFDSRSKVTLEGGVVVTSTKADRLILTCDPPNEILELSTELPRILKNAKLFLISGFNSIHEKSLLEKRIQEIEEYSKACPPETLIFFEDAGYHRDQLRSFVMQRMSKFVSFYSMNEEELQNYLNRRVDFQNASSVIIALQDISLIVNVPTLIIHTEHFSALMGRDVQNYIKALTSAMTMATTRYVYGDDFSVADFELIGAAPRIRASLAIAKEVNSAIGESGAFVPAFAVTCDSPTTIGLGDAFVGGFLLELSRSIAEDKLREGKYRENEQRRTTKATN